MLVVRIIAIDTRRGGALIVFALDDSMRDLLGFISVIKHDEKNLSDNPVDIVSFDNIFPGTAFAQNDFQM